MLVEGPWTHRFVGANGSRFHVVEAGTGPLVLFLHGFPEFWWAWHDIMTRVADAGFRAVAIDLRGYGASDKPPRGYDGYTMAADVTGLIRALGERSAMIVGAGAGRHDRLDGGRLPPQDGRAGWSSWAPRTRCGCGRRCSPTRAARWPRPRRSCASRCRGTSTC